MNKTKRKTKKQETYQVEYVPIKSINPNPNNPRTIDDKTLDQLVQSIEQYGLVQPIVVNKRNNQIVGGHQRWIAAQILELENVPVIFTDYEELQEAAANVAFNKITGTWDLVKLPPFIQPILDSDYITGFDESAIQDIINQNLESIKNEQATDDNFNTEKALENIKEPVTQIGDQYVIDGKHVIMCGSSTNPDDIKTLFGTAKFDLIVSSPPYYNQRDYAHFNNVEDYENFIFSSVHNSFNHSTKNAVVAWNIGNGECDKFDLASINSIQISKAGYKFTDKIVWRKKGGVFDVPRSQHIENYRYYPAFGYELIFVFLKGVMPTFDPKDHDLAREFQINVWDIPQVKTNAEEHPAAYPLRLPELLIRFYSNLGSTVYDPFLGSGTTLIAADQLDRVCYGMELSPKYCDVIIERYKQYKPEAIIENVRNKKI